MAGDDVTMVIGAQDKASSVLDSVASKFSGFTASFSTLGPIAAGVGTALAGVVAGFTALSGAIGAVSESANKIDALTDVATGLGASVGDLQAFQFAMSEAGNVDAEKSIQALQKLQKIVGDVATGGNESAGKLFSQLGVDADELSLQSPIDQFMAVKTVIGGVENVSERAALAQQLLGKSAADLIPALISESEEFAASMQAANDFGATVSEEGAQGIAAMNDAIGRVSAGMEGLANQAAVALAPAIESIANTIAEWIPPIITVANTYLPTMVDWAVQLAGAMVDTANTLYRIANFDFAGAKESLNADTAGQWMEAVNEARQRAAEAAEANAEKMKAIAQATRAVDEEALKNEERKAEAAAKTVEQLERKLMVAQMGEDAVKKQEELATATNDAEREKIRILQEQLDAQEKVNEAVKAQTKAAEDAAKTKEKEEADKVKEAEKIAEAFANVKPGVQASESRLLTRGPSEKGLDKVASNTAKTVTTLEAIKQALEPKQGKDITFELVGA